MGNIFQFKALQQLSAEDNLAAFIQKCRNELTVFGETLNWEAHVWPKIAVFAKLGVTTRKPKPDQIMNPGFIHFAKAYFRYQQGHNPTGTKNELKALRAIEAALLQVNNSSDISDLTYTVLDVSADLARQHYSG